jgi:DNA-binding FrmR family transcriptional regulator
MAWYPVGVLGEAAVGAEEVTNRLRRVEGQVRGLQRMVEEDRECEAILTQLIAARGALDRVGLLIAKRYVVRGLASPIQLWRRCGWGASWS